MQYELVAIVFFGYIIYRIFKEDKEGRDLSEKAEAIGKKKLKGLSKNDWICFQQTEVSESITIDNIKERDIVYTINLNEPFGWFCVTHDNNEHEGWIIQYYTLDNKIIHTNISLAVDYPDDEAFRRAIRTADYIYKKAKSKLDYDTEQLREDMYEYT